MDDRVKLSRVREQLVELTYPVTRDDAATALEDVTVTYADGEEDLGYMVSEVGGDTFESPDDLFEDLQAVLPVEALGEPGQSDGDA